MATHSSILVWRIPGTEEPGRLHIESMGSQRVGHHWATNTHAHTILIQETLIAQPISIRNSRKYQDDLGPDSILKDLFSKKTVEVSPWARWGGWRKKVKLLITQPCPTLQPCGLWPTRLLCPRNFPGKNPGVGNHYLLQGIFLTQESRPGLLHCRQILYCLSHHGSPMGHMEATHTIKCKNKTFFTLYCNLRPVSLYTTSPLKAGILSLHCLPSIYPSAPNTKVM